MKVGKHHFLNGCLAAGLVLVTAGFAVHGGSPTPVGPLGAAARPAPQGTVGSVEDEFAALSQQIPGFGGFAFDAGGNMIVHLKDPAQEAVARQVLGSYLNRWSGNPRSQSATRSIIVRTAQFDFSQLSGWRGQLRPAVLGVAGVASLDIDEGRNRVVIGVTDLALRDQISAIVTSLGIPAEAVIIEQREAARFAVTLRDYVRPPVGGLQLQYGSYNCTLGFNATRGTDRGFATNSHCTNTQGGVESTTYYQPSTSYSAIATEIADPGYWTGNGCPAGRRCRRSDSSFARYNSSTSSTLGEIARTTSYASTSAGSITIDGTNPRFYINAEQSFPYQGDLLEKVGRTTGWTYGSVSSTCVDVPVSGSDITLLCQDYFAAYAQGGDSGSPVFYWDGGTGARLYGLLWGITSSGSYFSAMSNIEGELGSLTTF